MESSVRYVQLPNAGQKPALCFRGSNNAYAIINLDGVIRTLDLDLKDYDKSQRVKSTKNGGEDYSPRAFADALERMSKDRRITTRAKTLLSEGFTLKPDDPLPEEEIMAVRKETDDEEILGLSVYEIGDVKMGEQSHKDKPKVRRLGPKRINREGQAETPYAKLADAIMHGDAGGKKRLNGSTGAPRSADPPRKPTPLAPLPKKAPESTKTKPLAKASRGNAARTLVSVLASELGIAEQPCRVRLRAAGMRAPYDGKNEVECRKALGLPTKGKK